MSISAASSSSSVSETASTIYPNQIINHPQHRVNSEATCQASSPPSSMVSFGKLLVCKCIDNRYPSSSNPLMSSTCKDEREENSPTWLHLVVVFLVSFKLQLLFEHLVCFLSLVAARQLAMTTKKELFSNLEPEKDPVISPSSSSDQSQNPKKSIINKVISSKEEVLISSCKGRSVKNVVNECLEVSLETQQSFPRIVTSSSLYNNLPRGDETRDENEDSSLLNNRYPSRLSLATIQNPSLEEDADDWGQFTEFDDDSISNSNPYNMYHTPDDPFQSINKTMMKKRGGKISVCKLERLQEGEEE